MQFSLPSLLQLRNHPLRWVFILTSFLLVAILDFSTPPAYILAYLYIVPVLLSISFLKPAISKALVFIAVVATLLNLVLPVNVIAITPVVVTRLIATLSIVMTAYFMVRFIRYQQYIQESEKILLTERNLAQMREDFVATLTHDLKTPLLGAQQSLEYLKQGEFGPVTNEQIKLIDALLKSSHRQFLLLENMLNVYKNDNLGLLLLPKPVNMDELIADSLSEMQAYATSRQVRLEYICSQAPPIIHADALQLKRVLANLIHNALNVSTGNSVIQIRLTATRSNLLIEVSDNGPGIPLEDLENVFTRFYQVKNKRQIQSTGIGLYLSRQIIDAHRGQIWVENLATAGCKFSFTLPME